VFVVLSEHQRTDEWYKARLGRLTGSKAAAMLASTKSGQEAAARRNLRTQLVLERITGQSQADDYHNADMARGELLEPEARSLYEARTSRPVCSVGFLGHPSLMAGASPDGVSADFAGLIEIKCPKAAIHLDYLRSKEVPVQYLPQIQHNLWITGAEWCDFVSYNQSFLPNLRLVIVRVTMDEAQRKSYELLVRMFLKEVDDEERVIRELGEYAV